jgi:colanic acid/amylovoran biosynthesis protein
MKKHKEHEQPTINNILIVNVHSSKNAGDYALLVQTIQYLEKAFGNINLTIMANWPNENRLLDLNHKVIGSPWWVIKVWDKNKKPRYQVISYLYGIISLFMYKFDMFKLHQKIISQNWCQIFHEYTNTDLVVAVSGNQLFSSGRFGWPLPVVGLPIYMAKFFKKRTIVFPQSIGPLKSNFDRHLVRFLYNNVDLLFIRDRESQKLVSDLKIQKSKPRFMHDVAFTFSPDDINAAKNILVPRGYNEYNNNIGITIISSMPSYLSSQTMQNYYRSFADMITTLIEDQGFDIFLFCQVYGPTDDENDFIGIEQVTNLLPDHINDHLHLIAMELSPAQLKACYGLMDLFIASRLHSGIFSLGMRVPTLFVGYLHKTLGVLKSINMVELNIDLGDVSSEILVRKVIDLWKNKSTIVKNIHLQLKSIETDLDAFPNEIRQAVLNREN